MVKAGDVVAKVYANDKVKGGYVREALLGIVKIGDAPAKAQNIILEIL